MQISLIWEENQRKRDKILLNPIINGIIFQCKGEVDDKQWGAMSQAQAAPL
jgi:hypothetical protein